MTTFKCTLITPLGILFDENANLVVAPGVQGQFGVLARHEHMVALLKSGVIRITQESKERFFGIDAGVLEVDGDHSVIILADRAVEGPTQEQAKIA